MGVYLIVKKLIDKSKKLFKIKKSKKLNVYSNLSSSRKAKKDDKKRKYAQYLASLPKNPIKRFLHHLKPKNFFKFWFSKRGLILTAKISGIALLLLILFVGGLFVYFRQDLKAISPGEIDKRVQSTVNKYFDRNGELLWEDKGAGNYKLVVDGSQISKYIKDATVAIEDRDFYKHNGVSFSGIVRAFVNNVSGGGTQGGSTLTQQLVKQVFFADEAQQRGLSGIPRKIKELVLSIEIERMYNKDQILNLYLNESPYGGRRNGVESGAQTYFGKSSKDLTLAEAALLASIPQSPSVFNPYNINGHDALIERQHTTLDYMADLGYITKDQAEEAKKYPIIDHINPESDQLTDIRAPHFVQMAKAELENTLGKATVGKGGLEIKTTVDIRIQNKLEEAMKSMFASNMPSFGGFNNGASTVEDVKTGQIIALVGSRDFTWPGYGQDNAATASIQPGSSIKPLVYAKLFEKKPAGQMNYGSGTMLKDEDISSIYGAPVRNADGQFQGYLTLRRTLATSKNIAAIKAMYISGVASTIESIHKMGVTSYCTQGDEVQVGLAAAIGGCGLKQVDLVNGFSSLARQGVYKPQSSILEVKDILNNEILQTWADTVGDQIIDPQSAYIVSDILNDDNARIMLTGYHAKGFWINGVPTATKTGTSDKGGLARDIWMTSYSPVIAMSVWLGNSDGSVLNRGYSTIPGPIVGSVMEYAHKEIYAPQGLWKVGDWFTQPSGIQRIDNELYPSWWNKSQGVTELKMNFDKVSKKKATTLTPAGALIELDVRKTIDPVSKKEIFEAPEGYNTEADDDVHKSTDVTPTGDVEVKSVPGPNKNDYIISVTLTPGTFSITGASIKVNDIEIKNITTSQDIPFTVASTSKTTNNVTITITDSGYYTNTTDIVATIPAYKD